MRAILRCNLAVVAALCAIVRGDLAVVDGSDAAVRGPSALGCGSCACVLRALTIARRTIAGGTVEITGCIVARFGFLVTQPSRDVTVARGQPRLSTPYCRQLVGPGILAVLSRLGAIFGCNFAVVDGSFAAVRGISAPRVGPGTFVSRALAVARRAIPCSSVAITGRVVARFGLSVTQPGRDVTIARGQPGLATAHGSQLVGSGILAIPGRLRAIVRGNLAVVDGSFAAVRGIGAARFGPRAFVCRAPAIAGRAIACGSVEVTGRVVTRFGVSVTLLGGEVTGPRGQPHTFAILRGLRAIVGCESAVVDGLSAVVSSFSPPRRGLRTLVCRPLPVADRAVLCGPVEITSRVVTRFGFSVAQPSRHIAVLRSQPRLSTARARQLVGPRILAVLGGLGSIFCRHLAVVDGLGPVVGRPNAPRGGLVTFVCRVLTVGGRAVPRGPIEIPRRVITGFGLSVAQPGRYVTVLGSEAGLPTPHS